MPRGKNRHVSSPDWSTCHATATCQILLKNATSRHFCKKVPSLFRTTIRTRIRICHKNIHPRSFQNFPNTPGTSQTHPGTSQKHPELPRTSRKHPWSFRTPGELPKNTRVGGGWWAGGWVGGYTQHPGKVLRAHVPDCHVAHMTRVNR